MPKKLTTEEFIQKAKKVHGDKYDYSEIEYINSRSNVKIICKVHGEFEQKAGTHLKGSGCKECYDDSMRSSTSEFINRAKEVHGDIYDYTLVKYHNSLSKVDIICQDHGIFKQSPSNHLKGRGCSKCKMSSGEKLIYDYLTENKIEFQSQKTFNDCKYKSKLRFDFFIPNKNIVIEYDGEFHFIPIKHWGNEENLKYRQKLDKIKTKFCKDNNIELLRIPYWEQNNIRTILGDMLK